MAIEFKYAGQVWRADTPEEARILKRQLEADTQAAIEHGFEPDWETEPVWTPDNLLDLFRGLKQPQKLFLKALCERTAIKSEEIMEILSIHSEMALAGVLSGLSKQLKKLGFKPWDLYTVAVEWNGKAKTRSFRLVGNFRWAAHEIGWPEKWI